MCAGVYRRVSACGRPLSSRPRLSRVHAGVCVCESPWACARNFALAVITCEFRVRPCRDAHGVFAWVCAGVYLRVIFAPAIFRARNRGRPTFRVRGLSRAWDLRVTSRPSLARRRTHMSRWRMCVRVRPHTPACTLVYAQVRPYAPRYAHTLVHGRSHIPTLAHTHAHVRESLSRARGCAWGTRPCTHVRDCHFARGRGVVYRACGCTTPHGRAGSRRPGDRA